MKQPNQLFPFEDLCYSIGVVVAEADAVTRAPVWKYPQDTYLTRY